jgi:rhomboid protease GluP
MQSSSSFGRRGASQPPFRAPAKPSVAVTEADVQSEEWDPLPTTVGSEIPFATLGLVAVLILIYACEQVFSFEPGWTQSDRSLVAFGAESRGLVFRDGQWWRLLTAMLLHGSVAHICGNCIALLCAGYVLERRIGAAWLLLVFILGGVAASLSSLVWNADSTGGMGASGGLMALLVTSLFEAFGHGKAPGIQRLRIWLVIIIVVSLIPRGGHIDYIAHMGGDLAGAVLGFALLVPFPRLSATSVGRYIATGFDALVAVATAIGFILVVLHYPAYAARNAGLIADGQLDRWLASQDVAPPEERGAQLASLLEQHPNDPRGHMFRAEMLLRDNQFDESEREARLALSNDDALTNDLAADVKPYLHGLLADILYSEGRHEEARVEGRALCNGQMAAPETTNLHQLRLLLEQQGVCS